MKKIALPIKIYSLMLTMDDAQAGAILKAIINYHCNGIIATFTDSYLQMLWTKVSSEMARQEDIRKMRKEIGKMGGSPILLNQKVNQNEIRLTKMENLDNQNDVCLTKRLTKTENPDNINNINNNIVSINNKKEEINKEEKEKKKNNPSHSPEDKERLLEKRKQEFYNDLIPYVSEYGKELIREFFDYWSEANKSKTKMRWEMQPTWETKKRLATWQRNDDKRKYPNNGNKQTKPSLDEQAAELVESYLNGSRPNYSVQDF